MIANNNLRAILHIQENTKSEDIKRLALFFDEIYYILPGSYIVTKETLDKRKVPGNNQTLTLFEDFNKGISISLKDLTNQPLKETLQQFEEEGIVKSLTTHPERNEEEFKSIANAVVTVFTADETFIKISEGQTVPNKTLKISYTVIGKVLDGTDRIFQLGIVDVPQSLEDCVEIATNLYISKKEALFPIFINQRYSREMEYIYEQYKKGLKEILNEDVNRANSFNMNFGEITFNVANSLFNSDLISTKTPKQIIKYRNALAEARKHFLSEELIEIASLAENNPWSQQTKNEIQKYLDTKLNKNILQYNDQSKETWEKLFGTITVQLVEVGASSILGSGAGGLIGKLIPGTSAWNMLLAGALVGMGKQAPELVRNVKDILLEIRKSKRSSIAYIAEFGRKSTK